MSRTRVKICGITCETDALAAIRAGAHALGFNGYEKSKRFIDLVDSGDWIRRLPSLVCRVAVLVNPSVDAAIRVASLPWIDAVQLHGDEPLELVERVAESGITVIKALQVGPGAARPDSRFGSYGGLLLDAWAPGEYGGTGRKVDLETLERLVPQLDCPVIVAGGLSPDNVGMLVQKLQPYAVDVASGVEVEGDPRRKDPAKLIRFMREVGDGYASAPERGI